MRLPRPVSAAIGLAATAAGEARHLPDRAIELPMLAVSTALQMSLRAQQRYAELAAKGDAVLNRRPPSADPPAWATFDDDDLGPAPMNGAGPLDDDTAAQSSKLIEDLFGTDDPGAPGTGPSKRVSKPRHTKPSPFDDAG